MSKVKSFIFKMIDRYVLGDANSPFENIDDIINPPGPDKSKEPYWEGENYVDPAFEEKYQYKLPKEIFPYFKITGEGYKWYLNPVTTQMVKIKLGSTVVKLTENPDSQGRVIVYLPDQYVAIPENELMLLGFN